MTITPTPSKHIRLTITVTPEVHETFQRIAKAASMPLGRAMGEWLGDTLDAALFTAQKMEQARAAPGLVVREMQAMAMGMVDEVNSLTDHFREMGVRDRAAGARSGPLTVAPSPHPPSSNTGGKGTKQQPKSKRVST